MGEGDEGNGGWSTVLSSTTNLNVPMMTNQNRKQDKMGDWLCEQCSTTPAQLSLGGPPDDNTVSCDEGILVVTGGWIWFLQTFMHLCYTSTGYT